MFAIVLEKKSLKPVLLGRNQGIKEAAPSMGTLGEDLLLAFSSFWWGSVFPGFKHTPPISASLLFFVKSPSASRFIKTVAIIVGTHADNPG